MREGNPQRQISRFEAILWKQMEAALKGNDRAAQAATKMAMLLGLLQEKEPAPVWDLSGLTDDELRILERIASKIARN